MRLIQKILVPPGSRIPPRHPLQIRTRKNIIIRKGPEQLQSLLICLFSEVKAAVFGAFHASDWHSLRREVELHLNLKFKQCPEKLIAGSLKPFALERTGQIMDPFSPGFCCPTCFISTKAAVQSMIPPKGLQHHDSNCKSLTHCCLNPLKSKLPSQSKFATYFPSVCALVS